MRFLLLLVVLAGCPAKSTTPPVEEPKPVEETSPTAATLDGDRLVVPGTFVFEETTLDATASADALEASRAFLADRTDVTLARIEGHTDGDRSEDDVMFSGERALQVGLWLIDHGIACERLIIAGFGGWKPVADNETPEGKAQNRRIEIVMAELRGTAIGGMPVDGDAPAAVPACN